MRQKSGMLVYPFVSMFKCSQLSKPYFVTYYGMKSKTISQQETWAVAYGCCSVTIYFMIHHVSFIMFHQLKTINLITPVAERGNYGITGHRNNETQDRRGGFSVCNGEKQNSLSDHKTRTAASAIATTRTQQQGEDQADIQSIWNKGYNPTLFLGGTFTIPLQMENSSINERMCRDPFLLLNQVVWYLTDVLLTIFQTPLKNHVFQEDLKKDFTSFNRLLFKSSDNICRISYPSQVVHILRNQNS